MTNQLADGADANRKFAVITGCDTDVRDQIMLLLDLLGWDIDKVDRLEDIARIRAAIVFIGDRVTATEQAKAAISAAKNSKTVVLVGGSPAGTANNFLSLESVYYLETPLDIAALERLIQNVS